MFKNLFNFFKPKKKPIIADEFKNLTPEHQVLLQAVQSLVEPLNAQNRKALSFQQYKFWIMGAFFIGLLMMSFGSSFLIKNVTLEGDYVSLVNIDGPIAPDSAASPQNINPMLVKAFEDEQAKGVIIHINSPGGTPVAASAIRERIIELREEHPEKKVVVFGADYMTSGAYMIATGADTIYANESSLVGSIGVIVRAFGATELADKLGVERRVVHAGVNKAGLDTFLPFTDEDKKKMEDQLTIIHDQFIAKVKQSRAGKLDTSRDDIFTGAYWTGQEAMEMGLVDGLGHLASISEELFETTNFQVYSVRRSNWSKLVTPVAEALTAKIFGNSSTQPLLMPY